ncbi:LLM class F420-dependent oxidoreductase [Pseudonocardia acaciae]|uniref:LLM class F420-dependent oxidoreductase n=1 Tax=Pseudonocardia acaciae TaxID=551276 RepID=UPI00068411AD|nr:LLM class F420-dependent oxidoreductase [Pseudonocardia acaciae]
MRFWNQLPQGGWVASRENVRVYAMLTEELGLHGLWVGDHIVIPPGYESQYPYAATHPVPADRPFLEAYTTLAYVAGATQRVRIAVTAAVTPYRHPLLHAKVAATLDHLSGGRLEIALGVGWLREEFDALGAQFKHRGAVTDETIESMLALWTGEPVSYAGKHVSFDTVQCLPQPVQRPGPPLWIGGSGPRAIRRMKRFGAGWLGPDMPVSTFLEQVEQARADGDELPVSAKVWLLDDVDPDGDELAISVVGGSPDLAVLKRLAAAGITDIRLDLSRLPSHERPKHIHAFARASRKEGLLSDDD